MRKRSPFFGEEGGGARKKREEKWKPAKKLSQPTFFPRLTNSTKQKTGPLGLSICYDLRFPELYQQLRFEKQARVLAVPAAFTETTGRAGHWEVLLRARAIENQCAVVAAAQVGEHNEGRGKRRSWGQAMIIDASGKVLARMKSADEVRKEREGEGGRKEDNDDDHDEGIVGIIVADLGASTVEGVREGMPVAEHREAGRRALGL